MMYTKNIVSPYHHTLISAKQSYKIIFSNAKSFYLRLGSYLNVYVSFHVQLLYKYKYLVVKLYLNLCFCFWYIYILFWWGGLLYCYLGPCIQKVFWIPVVPIFTPISHKVFKNIKYSLFKLFCTISRLCEGTPLRQLWLDFFWSTLPCVPELTMLFLNFCRQDNIIRVNVHSP